LGFAGDLDKIKNICAEKNILLLEDNCEALGTELPAGKTGNFGVASTFSFFVAHHMSTVEGGMACTDDEELAEMLRIVRANGWDRNLSPESQTKLRQRYGVESEFTAKYTFFDLGFNLRPNEMTGFLGRKQLQYLPDNIKARENNYLELEKSVKFNNELVPLRHNHIKLLSSFAFPVLCSSTGTRSEYVERFHKADVEIRPMIAGNIQEQPFYKKYVGKMYYMPGASKIHDMGFYCGNYPELNPGDIAVIKNCLSGE
jgi:CDP-6-deoxy-D-xylo-4-hexulose-3-dehydrase